VHHVGFTVLICYDPRSTKYLIIPLRNFGKKNKPTLFLKPWKVRNSLREKNLNWRVISVWKLNKHKLRTCPFSAWYHCPFGTDKLSQPPWMRTIRPLFHYRTPCRYGSNVTRSSTRQCWMVALQANRALLETSLMFIRVLYLVTFRLSEASCCNARCVCVHSVDVPN
jgi:hypothetical protein